MFSNEDWNLMAKYLAGEADEKEIAIIKSWKNDPEKRAVLERVESAFGQDFKSSVSFDSEKVQKMLQEKIKNYESNYRNLSQQTSYRSSEPYNYHYSNRNLGLKIAATVVLFILVGFTVYWFTSIESSEMVENTKFIERSNPARKRSVFQLPDGSKVHLNVASTIKIPEVFSIDRREVFLTGEAFFEVKKDTQKPFIVHSGEITTRVMGTSFNVKSFPEDQTCEVVVATGLVSVSNQKDSASQQRIQLKPDQQAIFDKSQANFEKYDVNAQDFQSWKEGILLYKNDPWPEIIRDLERWYGVEFSIRNDRLKQKVFTGEFPNMSLDQVLTGMSFSLDFQYTIQDDEVIIY